MPETGQHRRLVSAVARRISLAVPSATVLADLPDSIGAPVPPAIGGFRPDVWARGPGGETLALAEAKVRGIDDDHTQRQISAFLRHLDTPGKPLFVLAVPGELADSAKTLLRVLRLTEQTVRVRLGVFDELDLWRLDAAGGRQWHLD